MAEVDVHVAEHQQTREKCIVVMLGEREDKIYLKIAK